MARVLMYTTRICPYCRMAERLLEKKGIADVDRIMVDDQPERREEMTRRTGRKTVPQIFIGETHVGGYTDLADLDRHGKLDPLLAQP